MQIRHENEETLHAYPLVLPRMPLDVTGDPWAMPETTALNKVGVDVIRRGRIAPETGRKSLDVSVLAADRPVVTAASGRQYGTGAVRIAGVYATPTPYVGTTTSLRSVGVAWDADVVGAYIVRNDDNRRADVEAALITSLSNGGLANDTINFEPAMTAWAANDKFSVVYGQTFDKRGVWLCNGRKFWLLRNGTATLYLDLGSDTYKGQRWIGCQIGHSRYLFVNATYPPRVIDIAQPAGSGYGDLRDYPGLFPFAKQVPKEQVASGLTLDRNIYAIVDGHDGTGTKASVAISPSEQCRLWVRGINEVTLAESELVPVSNWAWKAANAGSQAFITKATEFRVSYVFDGAPEAETGSFSGYNIRISYPGFPKYVYRAGDALVITSPASIAGTYYPLQGTTVENAAGVTTQVKFLITPSPTSGLTGLTGYIRTRTDGATVTMGMLTFGDDARAAAGGNFYMFRGGINLMTNPEAFGFPFDNRWTHVEVWRTDAAGVNAYRESRIALMSRMDPESPAYSAAYIRPTLIYRTPTNRPTCHLSDAALVGQQGLMPQDRLGGRLPPVCQRVASLLGITFFGGAASVASEPAVSGGYAPAFGSTGGSTASGGAYLSHAANVYTNYTPATGDQLVITSPASVAGTYTITAKPFDDRVQITTTFPATTSGTVVSYIQRPMNWSWPILDDDELIYHTRTDKFAPESVVAAPVRLSTIGDTFQNMVPVAGYVCVVMRGGVHLLYPTASGVAHETVSEGSDGTPWPDSLVAYENVALWATEKGIRICKTSPTPNGEGRRGELAWLDPEDKLRAWFRDAYAGGYDIDAGLDAENHCVRFRRRLNNDFQTLQINLKTGEVTLLDDDSGIAYVNSRYAGTSVLNGERLYSVTAQSNLFEVNTAATTDAYAGKTVQATLDNTYTITTTSITKTGVFSTAMLGDIVRIYSSTAARNGLARRILTATANAITFDAITGLAAGDEFVIGAVRFKIRKAFSGTMPPNVKRIHSLEVRAYPGERHATGAMWAGLTPGKFTLRFLREAGAVTADEEVREISIYSDEVVAALSGDEHSALAADGKLIQVELENVNARTDFRIARAMVMLEEEGNQIADASATA